MLVMLLFAGVTTADRRPAPLSSLFTDRSGAAGLGNPLVPPRADIVDRNGVPLARTIDAWSIGSPSRPLLGNRGELAVKLAG